MATRKKPESPQPTKKRGRPRTKEVPEPSPSRTVAVYFKTPGGEEVSLAATHRNVPGDWPHEMILSRLGIGRHFKVVVTANGKSSVLQDFVKT